MPTTKERSPSTTQQKSQQGNQQPEMTLSEAASIMRDDSASPEDRSRAASVMGREGGKHSHDRDAKSSKTTVDQSADQQQGQSNNGGSARQKETT